MARRTFVFAGGGTGGHLFPGISVAHAVRRLVPDARVCFLTTTRELDRKLLEPTDFEQTPQGIRPMPSRPWGWPGFLVNWWKSERFAREFIRRQRPEAVLGLGGYAAGPAIVAGRRMGVRTAILNPDAIPGRANKRLAKHASLVVTQWDCSARFFSSATTCRAFGCPVRADFAPMQTAEARLRLGLDPGRPTIVATGASQGARTVNEAMSAAWPAFAAKHDHWQLLHLTGAADESTTRAAYKAAGAQALVVDFLHEMHVVIAAADIVISRAGASTLAELTLLGRPSILLPYPYHRDRHQHANGQVLVDAGAAIMLEDLRDAELNREPLRQAMTALATDSTKRQNMASAALKMGRPNAAADVAQWLVGMDGPQGDLNRGIPSEKQR